MASADSDGGGHFLMLARAGIYTIKARPQSGALPRPASQVITIRDGQVLVVKLMLDSGIR